jgi:exopolysaccharide biosynthesis polyprenyl glycosylphosphotransferase
MVDEKLVASGNDGMSMRGSPRYLALVLVSFVEGLLAALPTLLVLHLTNSDAEPLPDGYIVSVLALGVSQMLFTLGGFDRDLWGRARLLRRVVHGVVTWTLSFALVRLAAVSMFGAPFTSPELLLCYAAGGSAILVFRLLEFTSFGRALFDRARPRAVMIGAQRALDALSPRWAGPLGSTIVDRLPIEDFGRVLGGAGRRPLNAQMSAWIGDGVDEIVLVGDISALKSLDSVIASLSAYSVGVSWITQYAESGGLQVPMREIRVLSRPVDGVGMFLKRALDMVGAGIGILLLSPVLLGAAIAIRLDTPGPILFRQERRGLNGASFTIWKFRSMSVTESGREMVQVRPGDARVTRVGRILRATSIDELPQLFNVLFGAMSLVGPRPHAIRHDEELAKALPRYVERRRVKPGITGWAQVHGWRGETTTLAQMSGRTAMDLIYVENWSIFLDVWILILTIISPKSRQNAH